MAGEFRIRLELQLRDEPPARGAGGDSDGWRQHLWRDDQCVSERTQIVCARPAGPRFFGAVPAQLSVVWGLQRPESDADGGLYPCDFATALGNAGRHGGAIVAELDAAEYGGRSGHVGCEYQYRQ